MFDDWLKFINYVWDTTPSVVYEATKVGVPSMDIEFSLQINLRFEEGKKVSVGNIATKIRDLGLEQKAIEAVIEK